MVMKIVLVLFFLVSIANATPSTVARKENVKYLRCAVCERIGKQLSLQVQKKPKLTEFDIIELAEKLCDVKKEESEWMFYLDIVQEGNNVKLVEHDQEGECGTKCKTIARTCLQVLGDHDTDVAEFIFKNKDNLSEAAISKLLCYDLSNACSKPQPVPKDVDFGEAFTPKASKDADISKLMRSMSGMPGAPGMKMYSKDDLANMKNLGGEDEEDEDDEDDDEEGGQKQRSNLNSEKKSLDASSLKERVLRLSDKVREQSQVAMKQATKMYNKASKYVKKWMKNKTKTKKKSEL